MTTDEAAQRLGVTAGHLEKLRVLGGGPTFLKLGRSVRYEPADLQHWIATCRRRSTSQTAAETH
ncbi:helix-turn-helix transcriptional regulator [Methylobacterium brachiatum]|uniref:helix-turn-helix transcriptional regulator n=1 Tax=Methylobacterium brachiatum TaxID=269660 RepID=UPI00244A578E|nr:helix-turn-helix domain-containing protein [Methylobacterium brachiatum]MDH2313985.1 helix-turn-helix domain-containing protein [Methylobacterium brachiatum]